MYERKLDGLRCIAVRAGDRVELWSRSRRSFTGRFGGIVAAMAGLPGGDVVLDGEIVALEGDRTSFALLQRPGSKAKPLLYVFDVLHVAGEDLTGPGRSRACSPPWPGPDGPARASATTPVAKA